MCSSVKASLENFQETAHKPLFMHVLCYLFPDLPGCNLDMVLDLPCSGGSGGVGIVVEAVHIVSSSGMVGHEVKVLLPASEGVPEAPREMKHFINQKGGLLR